MFVHVQWADTVYVLPAVCVCQSLLSAGFSVSASMKIESSHQCLLNFITWPVLIYTTHKSVCARVCVRELWSGVDYANRNPAVGPHAGAPCVCVRRADVAELGVRAFVAKTAQHAYELYTWCLVCSRPCCVAGTHVGNISTSVDF